MQTVNAIAQVSKNEAQAKNTLKKVDEKTTAKPKPLAKPKKEADYKTIEERTIEVGKLIKAKFSLDARLSNLENFKMESSASYRKAGFTLTDGDGVKSFSEEQDPELINLIVDTVYRYCTKKSAELQRQVVEKQKNLLKV